MYSGTESESGLRQLRHTDPHLQQFLFLGELGVLQRSGFVLSGAESESGLRQLRHTDSYLQQLVLLGELGFVHRGGGLLAWANDFVFGTMRLGDEDMYRLVPVGFVQRS